MRLEPFLKRMGNHPGLPAPVLFVFLLVWPAAVFGARDEVIRGGDVVSNAVQFLGGERKFQRFENLRYDFMEVRVTPGGRVTVSGRHIFKWDGGVFRARVETGSPQGQTLTILTSSGVWHWDNGRELKDPPLLARIQEDILENAFWLAAPFRLSPGKPVMDYAGLGYVEGKLDRRVRVQMSPLYPLPNRSNFTLFFDTATSQLDGASFSSPEGRPLTLLLDRYVGTNTIGLPTRRVLMDAEHNMVAQFAIMRPEVNTYIDEALLDPEKARPAPPPPPPVPAPPAPAR